MLVAVSEALGHNIVVACTRTQYCRAKDPRAVKVSLHGRPSKVLPRESGKKDKYPNAKITAELVMASQGAWMDPTPGITDPVHD